MEIFYFMAMTKLIAHMIPGVALLILFTLLKTYVFPAEWVYITGFAYFSGIFCVLCVVIPAVIYFIRTPKGISYK